MSEVTQVIYDYQSLKEMINDPSGVYQLGTNIDCTASAYDGGWNPFNFTGELYGNGYAISNLQMNRTGFFRYIVNGIVSGVGFVNCTVHNAEETGILGCQARDNSLIERCYVEGCSVIPHEKNGGTNCGGLLGCLDDGVNYSNYPLVKECYVANSIIGQENSQLGQFGVAGGFIARTGLWGLVQDCYSSNCTIYCKNLGGGFVASYHYFLYGDRSKNGITRCYAANRVFLRDNKGVKGGFVAKVDDTADSDGYKREGNFYDLNVFGINNGKGFGYAKMTEQMKDQRTFEDKGWEFSIVNEDGSVIKKTWRIEDGLTYPYLQYNKQYKDIMPRSFLKFKGGENSQDLYAPLVDPNDMNLKTLPHLFVRV